MRIKHRTFLRTKDLRSLLSRLANNPNLLHRALGNGVLDKVHVERIILEDKSSLYFINKELWLVEQKDFIFPGLPALLSENIQLPRVVIDMGAVSHIANGADVMAPGIFDIASELVEGELVVIIDQKNLMPLAVGQMLVSGQAILETRRGRAIKTLHYVGDPLWKLVKELSG